MKILILGGTGYLGSNLIPLLVNRLESIFVVSRSLKFNEVRNNGNITHISNSIEQIKSIIVNEEVEVILNIISVYSQEIGLYESVIQSNLEFPLQVLDIFSKNNGKKFINIGTSLPESLNMYTKSKSIFANFGEYYSRMFNIDFYEVKLEMFYGKNEPINRFIPYCISTLIADVDLDLTDGLHKRDIIHVNDVCEGLVKLINAELVGYVEIPLGSGVSPTIKEIVEFIHSYIGSKSQLNFGKIEKRKNEPNCCADLTIMKSIGFEVKYCWKDGLIDMIDDYTRESDC